MALARGIPEAWPKAGFGRARGRRDPAVGDRSREVTPESTAHLEVVESEHLADAQLDGVRLAAREMAHLLNNDLAVAVGFVELLQHRVELPPRFQDLLVDAARSLDAAARHIREFQGVVRVAVKDTPAGRSLDLERSVGA